MIGYCVLFVLVTRAGSGQATKMKGFSGKRDAMKHKVHHSPATNDDPTATMARTGDRLHLTISSSACDRDSKVGFLPV
jgi:hypothetical protein